MKKSNCILAICVIGGIAGSTIALLAGFEYTPMELFENFLGSVLTGGLFAIPSGLLIVCEDIKRVRNEQAEILSELDACFKELAKEDFKRGSFENVNKNRFRIAELYKRIARELGENCLKKKERARIEDLYNTIFDFSSVTAELIEKYEVITDKNLNSDVGHIWELRNSCISMIQAIQEKNFE